MSAERDTTRLSEAELRAFEADAKIGLLATVSPDGLPHVSLITSIQGHGAEGLMFGQFTEGMSKRYVKENPKTAFLVMTADQRIWRGKARWSHEAKSGPEYEAYNRKPLFRYNAYSGIHTVYYLDLLEIEGPTKPSRLKIAAGHAATLLVRSRSARNDSSPVLNAWTRRLLSKVDTLKFLSYVGDDGYPLLVPLVPCSSADAGRLVFAAGKSMPTKPAPAKGEPVAVFAINLKMESVLVRGRLLGYRRYLGPRIGILECDWVYNSMPPKQGQIYPVEPARPVAQHSRPT